ncbi:MAG: hypothetical protein V2A34_00950, partial [Lentisphaerota bacterium]
TGLDQDEFTAAIQAATKAMNTSGPARFVPSSVGAERITLNAAELLYAMARAFLSMKDAGTWKDVTVEPAQVFPPYADALQELFKPKAVQPLCYTKGQLWTVKPARLKDVAAAVAPSPVGEIGPGNLLIVFAANLDSDQPCYREDHAGADLYLVEFNAATRQAQNLRRLTSRPGQAEWFPALSPDGRFMVYDESDRPVRGPSRHVLRALDLQQGVDQVLVGDARSPSISGDGNRLYYSSQKPAKPACIQLTLRGNPGEPLQAGASRIVSELQPGHTLMEDPAPFPDEKSIVFHCKGAEPGAGVAVIGIDGKGFQSLTLFDGSGHCSVSPDGQAVVCTRSRDGHIVVIEKDAEG